MTKIKNIKKELLSDNWYTLNKYTFDFKLQNGNWVTQIRESYNKRIISKHYLVKEKK